MNLLCNIYICSEIRNTDDSPLFRYETFIYFLTFRHEERKTQFLLCWLFLNRPKSTTPAGLALPRVKSQVTVFFKNHQILSPSLPGRTSLTPQSYFLSGVFIMTFVIVISSAHERELYSTRVEPIIKLT